MIEYQARLVEAVANAPDAQAAAHQLEDHGMLLRLDTGHEPDVFRGATISRNELERLRTIANVVRLGRVRHVGATEIELDGGTIPNDPERVVVDCTAQGLATSPIQAIFQPARIVLQFTTLGVAPWSAAILGHVETLDLDDVERNRLCPPVPRTGLIADYYDVLRAGFAAESTRRAEPAIQAWAAHARLNPGRSIPEVMNNPHAQAMFALMMDSLGSAIATLASERSTPTPT